MSESKPQEINATLTVSALNIRGTEQTTGFYFTLTVIEGNDFGCIFNLEKAETVLGRQDDQSDADIKIDDNRSSRRHILLMKRMTADQKAHVLAYDLKSTNGTFINGERLKDSEQELCNGDKIQIGSTVLKFEIKDRLDSSYHERVYKQVTLDPLTGLWNHNYIRRELEKLVSMGIRSDRAFSVLLMEIDFFQTLNEQFGRTVGDTILKATAQCILNELSGPELAARFAGKQFLVLLPETNLSAAANVADRLRKVVETIDFSSVGCQQKITTSIGVSSFPACGHTVDEILKQADDALFRTKQIGRNCVVVADADAKAQSKGLFVRRRLLAMLFMIAILTSVGYFGYLRYLNANARELLFSGLIEARDVEVGSKVGGRVKEVLVKEGQLVKAGQLLIKFEPSDLISQRHSVEARINEAEASLKKLENGNRPEEISEAEAAVRERAAYLEKLKKGPLQQEVAQARADLEGARSELNNAQADFKSVDEIYKAGYTSQQSYLDAENHYNSAKAKVESLEQRLRLIEAGSRAEDIQAAQEQFTQAQEKVHLLRSGSRVEDIAQARARLDGVKAELEQLNIQIEETEVKSPSDGVIEALSAITGDIVPPGKPIVKLLGKEQIWVRIFVPETELGFVYPNQKAEISVDTFPNKAFPGYVEQIAEQGEFIPRDVQTRSMRAHQVFGIKVNINNKDGLLKSGMAADVKLLNTPNK
jgi:diguanylate cyclase (GGDEF)-like protein